MVQASILIFLDNIFVSVARMREQHSQLLLFVRLMVGACVAN